MVWTAGPPQHPRPSREAEAQFGALERGDLAEAVNAARHILDNTLQRNAGIVPMPHPFTHGTSQQRSEWFKIGHNSGKLTACNTFTSDDR